MSRLIGINGFKTSGKDTTYEIIKAHEPGTKRAGFADKLKIMAMLALGYDGTPAELIAQANLLKEEYGEVSSVFVRADGARCPCFISGREYLQRFGGHARDVFGDTFWIDQVLPEPVSEPGLAPPGLLQTVEYERLKEIIDPWTGAPRGSFEILCITDVRYLNEAQRVLDLGGEVWEVRRPGLASDGHGSEQPLPPTVIDRVIDNDEGLLTLTSKVQAALIDNAEGLPGGRY